jgi:hypothetical protein
VFPVDDMEESLEVFFHNLLDTTIFLLSIVSMISLIRNMININEVYDKVWSRFSLKAEQQVEPEVVDS